MAGNPEAVEIIYSDRPITAEEAKALQLLLFGNLSSSFGENWKEQGFNFRSVPPYGFLQRMPGPCGVLAAVQAYVISELYFGESAIPTTQNPLSIKSSQQREALTRAITRILWKVGDKKSAILCLKQTQIAANTDDASTILDREGNPKYMHLFLFKCEECLRCFLQKYIANKMINKEDNYDCTTFLYSVLLTKGLEKIKEEMDDPKSHLIGEDGYCAQEVVNLILTGKAVTNLFDSDMELNSGGSETTLHHGIPEQSEIGLLSSFDYQGNTSVGKYYKEPKFPIWVLIGQSHFTVLFSKAIIPGDNRKFTLYHYNGLEKKWAETAFDINPNENSSDLEKDFKLPIVIQCIYTRWPNASFKVV